MIKEITSDLAPKPYGHYSHAVSADKLIFTATLLPIEPGTLTKPLLFQDQLNQLFDNLQHILVASGSSLNSIVRINFYVTDLQNWDELDKAFSARMKNRRPARGVIEVSRLRHDSLVAVDAVAIRETNE